MADPRPTATDDRHLFVNRELAQLSFNERVLEQAKDDSVPLLERLRFLTISSLILDEFFEIRVGGLMEQMAFGIDKPGPDGLSAPETLVKVRERVLTLVAEQYRVLNDVLLPSLAREGIVIYRREDLSPSQEEWLRGHFEREVLPVLTPVGLDPAHPFPRILNKSLNFIVSMEGKDAFGRKSRAAVVQAPRVLPRLIPLPASLTNMPHGFVLLSSVIHEHLSDLFPGMKVLDGYQFRVTRNSDLWVDEEEIEDLLHALKGELSRRNYGKAVRLEISDTCPPDMVRFLAEQFQLTEDDVYQVNGPVNLNRLQTLYDLVARASLKYPPFVPGLPPRLMGSVDLFSVLKETDVLLHHPYQSFAPVVELVKAAAHDPDVLAIKQTVYRTGEGSGMEDALVDAARAGKEVTAVVELRARFDEATNIELASKLQEAGAKVAYGIVGFKAHAKMLLIVRREGNSLRRYVHLGTGNYNPETARSYTDFGLLTSREEIGEDVHAIFQQLTGLGKVGKLKRLVQTPFTLHDELLSLIRYETEAAKKGKEARIAAKMNQLIEREVIEALYDASRAGVKVDLVVRGICCLKPGVKGTSENVRVRSIVGRFLEHHRVFHFHHGGKEITLCSSADWMPRNFFRRVEIAFPVEGKRNRQRVLAEGLEAYLEDNVQAWEMGSDGEYVRLRPGKSPKVAAQEQLLESLARRVG